MKYYNYNEVISAVLEMAYDPMDKSNALFDAIGIIVTYGGVGHLHAPLTLLLVPNSRFLKDIPCWRMEAWNLSGGSYPDVFPVEIFSVSIVTSKGIIEVEP